MKESKNKITLILIILCCLVSFNRIAAEPRIVSKNNT